MQEIRPSWEKLKQILKTSYSSYVTNEILIDDRLNPLSVKVYCTLNALCFGQDKVEAYPSHKLLAYLCNCCTRSIGRSLKILEQLGYVRIKRTLGSVNLYTIVARFCNKVTNSIKDKAAKAKEFIQDKKNKKNGNNKSFPKSEKAKKDNWNNYQQREYSSDYLDSLEKQLLGWEEPKTTQFNEIYQQALLL